MITIFDPRTLQLPMPFDSKMYNYFLENDGVSITVETIPEYLLRVDLLNRSLGAIVTILLPKVGYSTGSFFIMDFITTNSTQFDIKYYGFINGLDDVNFVELFHPPVTIATESINQASIGTDQVLHLKQYTEPNYLVYGTVTWLHDYVFHISDCGYYIGGVYYTSLAHDVTLVTPDGIYDRIDTFYVDISPTSSVITGNPSPIPIATELDLGTQLLLENVLVKTGTTSPDGITDDVIYDENVEWTTSTEAALYGATVDFEDVNSPYHASVQTRITFAANHFDHVIISYTKTSNVDISNSNLIIPIRTSRAFSSDEGIYIRIKNTFTNIGIAIIIKDGTYGFNSSSTLYQELTIPFADFHPTQNLINVVWIGFINNGAGTAGITTIDFDYIRIQKGIAPVTFTETDPIFNEWLISHPNLEKDWITAEYRDVVAGVADSHVLNLKAFIGYTIYSISLLTDNGTLNVTLKINGVSITGLSGISATTAITETLATAANIVTAGDIIEIEWSNSYTENPTRINVDLNFIR